MGYYVDDIINQLVDNYWIQVNKMKYLWIREDPETVLYFRSVSFDRLIKKLGEFNGDIDWGITNYAEFSDNRYELI